MCRVFNYTNGFGFLSVPVVIETMSQYAASGDISEIALEPSVAILFCINNITLI